MEFNIIATVGTTEVELPLYPGGEAKTPKGKTRKIYTIVLTNTAASANTLTLRIYKGATLEKSFNILIPQASSISFVNEKNSPTLLIPSERTLKAVASAASVDVLLAVVEE